MFTSKKIRKAFEKLFEMFDEDELEAGEILCPNCGEKLEFDLSDLAAEEEDED